MLIKKKDKKGNRIFYLNKKPSAVQVEARGCLSDEIEQKRKQFEKKIKYSNNKSPFIQELALAGHFDGKFPAHIIRAAKEEGLRPDGFDFHHTLPLSCGGTNESSNIVLVDRQLHEWLHKNIWDKVYTALKYYPNEVPDGKKVFILMPQMAAVVTKRDRFQFLSRRERILFRKEEEKKIKRPDKISLLENKIFFFTSIQNVLCVPETMQALRDKGLL